ARWDHIDTGVKKDFLRREYKNALNEKATPPCQKPLSKVKALSAKNRIVCYECGVECDLKEAAERWGKAAEVITAVQPAVKKSEPRFAYEFLYTKLSSAAWLSHLDITRLIPRIFRRAGVMPAYSQGFHPLPLISYPDPLPLGYRSAAERIIVRTEGEIAGEETKVDFLGRLNSCGIEGLVFRDFRRTEGSYKLKPQAIERYIIELVGGESFRRLFSRKDSAPTVGGESFADYAVERPSETDLIAFPDATAVMEISCADGKKRRPHKLIEEAHGIELSPYCFILTNQRA
ncbi:MAG: DUF2344 domain-containing protein, partial [Deltaproteobacteria bacterium]|nr:DUF2344 domain-containing protein [Deltaproteobacteria bacterium]